MLHLPRSLAAWPSPDFAATLKLELEQLDPAALPLQAGLTSSSYVHGDRFTVMVIGTREDAESIKVKVGIFYEGIVAGCNCADDPTPVEAQSEYCEVEVRIDKATAAAVARLVRDPY
jgi:hypothetical protein